MTFRLSNRWKGHLLLPKYICYYSTDAAAPPPNLMADYLINSLGFSKQEALSAAKKGRCSSFFRNDPDSVVNFFTELGLNKPQIKSIVSCCPNLLLADVDKTLQPKIKVLQDIALSRSDIVKVLLSYKSLLSRPLNTQILPPIEYMRNLLGSNELVGKAVLRYSSLLHWSSPEKLAPNISFLQKLGVSEKNVAAIMTQNPRILLREPQVLEKVAEMVENEYKMPRNSKMLYHGITAVYYYNKATIDRKLNIFRSFGWSEENILTLFGTVPYVVGFSEDRLRKGLKYFITELGCESDYLARHPTLINLSLEKRVKPRLKVINFLVEKGLIKVKPGLHYALTITEARFLKRFVLPYKDEIALSLPDVEFLKNNISPHSSEMADHYVSDIKFLAKTKRQSRQKQ